MKYYFAKKFTNFRSRMRTGLLIIFFVISIIALPFSAHDDSLSLIGITMSGAPVWAAENSSLEDYIDRAEKLLFAERYKDTVELIEEAINEGGLKSGMLYFYLALAYDNLDEQEPAVTNYKKAISLNINKKELGVSLKSLGIILRGQDRHKEATKYFDRYLKLMPSDPDADNIKGYIEYYTK